MGKHYNSDIEFSSGIGRFLHALTWPIRKFYIIIPLATLLYVTPIFFDIKPNEVHLWYKEKSLELYQKSMKNEFVKTSVEKTSSLGKTAQTWFSSEKSEQAFKTLPHHRDVIKGKGNEVLVDMPKQIKTQRKAFDRTSEVVPVEVKGLENAAYTENSVNVSAVELMNNETPNLTIGSLSNGSLNVEELINLEKKVAGLVYLKTSKILKGEAKVVNANELEVKGVYVLLYGVYVAPDSSVGKEATQYLEEKTSSSEIKCNIVAYTVQGVATAVCFADGENLNKELIEKKLTKNVAF